MDDKWNKKLAKRFAYLVVLFPDAHHFGFHIPRLRAAGLCYALLGRRDVLHLRGERQLPSDFALIPRLRTRQHQ